MATPGLLLYCQHGGMMDHGCSLCAEQKRLRLRLVLNNSNGQVAPRLATNTQPLKQRLPVQARVAPEAAPARPAPAQPRPAPEAGPQPDPGTSTQAPEDEVRHCNIIRLGMSRHLLSLMQLLLEAADFQGWDSGALTCTLPRSWPELARVSVKGPNLLSMGEQAAHYCVAPLPLLQHGHV